jgi:hypothetical protein
VTRTGCAKRLPLTAVTEPVTTSTLTIYLPAHTFSQAAGQLAQLTLPRRLIGVLSHAVHAYVGTEVRKTLKIFAAEVRT